MRSSDPGRTVALTTLPRRAVDDGGQPGRGAGAHAEDAREDHPRRVGRRGGRRGVTRARCAGAAWRRRRPRPVVIWSRAAATVWCPSSRRLPPTPAAAWRSCRRARATTSRARARLRHEEPDVGVRRADVGSGPGGRPRARERSVVHVRHRLRLRCRGEPVGQHRATDLRHRVVRRRDDPHTRGLQPEAVPTHRRRRIARAARRG